MKFLELAQAIDHASDRASELKSLLHAAEDSVAELVQKHYEELSAAEANVSAANTAYKEALTTVKSLYAQMHDTMTGSGFNPNEKEKPPVDESTSELKKLWLKGQALRK